jgi:hypothetical protein
MSLNEAAQARSLLSAAWQGIACAGSPRAAVGLLVSLASLLLGALLFEAQYGPEAAHWHIYDSTWFAAAWGLVGCHGLAAAARRWPWKLRDLAPLATYAGVLTLLAGALVTRAGGVFGTLLLVEGQPAQSLVVEGRGQFTAFWVGQPERPSVEFTFAGGPDNWPSGRSLPLGEVDGVRARLLAYLPHATCEETWIADATGQGGPAVQFKAIGQNGALVADGWIVDQQFGDAVAIGPLRLQLERAASDAMRDDFLRPSAEAVGGQGRLTMYFGDATERVDIEGQVGKKIALGSAGAAVEIVAYLPSAAPDKLGNFTSKSDEPKNPMVELRVHLPEQELPLRQIAFAKDPLLNLDGVYSRVCPVKFRYEHPAVQPQSGVDLLQTSDGGLFGRLRVGGQLTSLGKLAPGAKLPLPGNFTLEIVQHIPRAARKVTFTQAPAGKRPTANGPSGPAALVEIAVGGKREQTWLRSNDPHYGQATLALPGGVLAVTYGDERQPLRFALELVKSELPSRGSRGVSAKPLHRVRIVEPDGTSREQQIGATQPLAQAGFTLHQTSAESGGQHRKSITLQVVRDPGRPLKRAGGVLIGCGLVAMLGIAAGSRVTGRFRASSRSQRGEGMPRKIELPALRRVA